MGISFMNDQNNKNVHLTLTDFDTIEISNLNNNFYLEKMI